LPIVRVRHGPVDRQAKVAPETLERLFVFLGQAEAELDEVGRDIEIGCFGGSAAAENPDRTAATDRSARRIVLHAALGRQTVVVPTHRIEHFAPRMR
jgi:hypothetical protein